MKNPTDEVNKTIQEMCEAAVKAVDLSGITDNNPEIQIQEIIKDEIVTCANRIRKYLEEHRAGLKQKESDEQK